MNESILKQELELERAQRLIAEDMIITLQTTITAMLKQNELLCEKLIKMTIS